MAERPLAGTFVKKARPQPAIHDAPLSLFAGFTVAAMFGLIFVGGLVTSWQAGMAVPDWPLSFGSLNPEGWWGDLPVRLEHGHRIFASIVGLIVTILCAWVWRNGWPLLIALLTSASLSPLTKMAGLPPFVVMHVGIWSFAGAFAAALILMGRRYPSPRSRLVCGLAFAAFVGVCLQATFGGLRVTLETAGHFSAAMTLRIVHGCVAQAELCLVVALAVMLSRWWNSAALPGAHGELPATLRLARDTVASVFAQLILGAAMRHLGAGLAIPTFPQAKPGGGFLPDLNPYAVLNFLHTRVGAFFVTLLILGLVASIFRMKPGVALLTRPAWLLLGLLLLQVGLGMSIVWHQKPVTLTTVHVVNGAAILATSLVIALRTCRLARGGENALSHVAARSLQEVSV